MIDLAEHLAEAKGLIDTFVDASDEGLEVVRGCHTDAGRANWTIQLENIVARYDERRARWMINRVRTVVLFPKLLRMDNASTTLRIIHPLAVDLTQCEACCIAPAGRCRDRAAAKRAMDGCFTTADLHTGRQSQHP